MTGSEHEGGGASQSTEPASGSSAATDVSLREHFSMLRAADLRFAAERDRRYTELRAADERALQIKEAADRDALELARQIQTYKDEKANELREQINRERVLYLPRDEYMTAHRALIDKLETGLKPLADYVTAQQGGPRAITGPMLAAGLGALATVLGIVVVLANVWASR